MLAAEGLVTMKVRRGAYVTEVSKDDLADVYHLLSLLECDAAAVGCRKSLAARNGRVGATSYPTRSRRAD